MNHRGTSPRLLLGALLLVAACQDITRPSSVPDLLAVSSKSPQCPSIPKTTRSITIVPVALTVAPGASRQLTLVNQAGITIANCAASWSASSPQQATVTSLGVVNGVSVGQSTVTATLTSGRTRLTATAQVTVARPVASVTLSAPSTRLLTDSSSQLTAELRDATGTILSDRSITWTSSDSSVATVTPGGLVSALKAGPVTITATSEGVSSSLGFTMYLNPKVLGIVYGRESDLQLFSMRADGANHRYVAPGVHPTQVGNVLVARGALNDNNLYTMDPLGGNRRFLTGGAWWPHFNTTGTRFVHLRGDCGTNTHFIATTNSDGTGTTNSGQCTTLRPVWSPSADVIAFGIANKLYIMRTDFTDVSLVLDVSMFGSFDWVGGLAWSPDGTRLLFSARPLGESSYSLYLVNVNGTGLTRLTQGDGNDDVAFDWSSQGNWLLITSRRTGNDQIWLRSLDGHMAIQLTNTMVPERHDPRFTR